MSHAGGFVQYINDIILNIVACVGLNMAELDSPLIDKRCYIYRGQQARAVRPR